MTKSTMTTYRIVSRTSGYDLGTYRGASPSDLEVQEQRGAESHECRSVTTPDGSGAFCACCGETLS